MVEDITHRALKKLVSVLCLQANNDFASEEALNDNLIVHLQW